MAVFNIHLLGRSSRLPWAFLALLIFTLLLNLSLISGFLLTLFLGWMIAEVVRPIHVFFQKKKIRPRPSSLLVTIIATLVIIVPIFAIMSFTIQKTVVLVNKQIAQGPPLETLTDRIWSFKPAQKMFDDKEELTQSVARGFNSVSKRVPAILSGLAENIPHLVLQLFLALITCYFVLVDGTLFAKWIGPRIPLPKSLKDTLRVSLTNTAVSSVNATLVTAAAQALVILITFLALGLPAPHLAFGISFIFAWFPLFGVAPVWIFTSIALVASGRPAKALIMAGCGVIASLVDNFVRPWFLKGHSDIHPLVSLVFVFGNIEVFGIFGVFTGPVLAKLLINCLDAWPKAAPAVGLEEE